MKYKLRYVGPGLIPGIPPKDLTAEQVKEHGGAAALKATGLYEDIKLAVQPSSGKSDTEK